MNEEQLEKVRGLFDRPGLDEGIEGAVLLLMAHGVETYESCEGGEGHAYPEPTICFYGPRPEGLRALAIARTYGLPVKELRRFWRMDDDEPVGPDWQITLWRASPLSPCILDTFCSSRFPQPDSRWGSGSPDHTQSRSGTRRGPKGSKSAKSRSSWWKLQRKLNPATLTARGRSGFVARGGGPVRCVVLQGTSRGGSCWIASGSGLRAGS